RQEMAELGLLSLHPDIVPEAVAPRHRRPRLPGVELPGMEVEHHRLALDRVDAPDGQPDQRAREEAEVPAAPDRKIRSEEPQGSDRELDQAAMTVAPDLVREARGAAVSVAIVRDRIDA